MRRVRVLLIALASLAGLLVVAAAALYGIARLDWFGRQAAAQLSATLGWPVTVGPLAIGYFPQPSVDVEKLSVAATPDGNGPPLIEVAQAHVELPWRTVLGLDSAVRSIVLRAPQLRLSVDEAGAGNWAGFLRQLATLGGGEPAAWSIADLQVVDGGVEFRQADGAVIALTGLALGASDVGPGKAFPLDLRLAGEAERHTFHFKVQGRAMLDPEHDVYAADALTLAGWLGGDDLPLAGVEGSATLQALRVDLAAQSAELRGLALRALGIDARIEAEATALETLPVVNFKLVTQPFSPRRVGLALARPLPETADPAVLTRAAITLEGGWNTDGLTLGPFEGELDDSRFSGRLALPAGPGPLSLRLEVDAVDLDRYLPPAPAAPTPPASPQAALQALLGFLQALDVDGEIRIGQARAAGYVAERLKVVLTPVETGKSP